MFVSHACLFPLPAGPVGPIRTPVPGVLVQTLGRGGCFFLELADPGADPGVGAGGFADSC